MLISMPFLCFGFTYWAGTKRIWMMDHIPMGTGEYALAMRFISAGVLFSKFGFPLLGRDIKATDAPWELNEGHFYQAVVIDNAYIYYLIAIGGILLLACMLWLSFGNYLAIRAKDYALVLMSVFLCVYGLIETVLFQFEHNYFWLFPATALVAFAQRPENVKQPYKHRKKRK